MFGIKQLPRSHCRQTSIEALLADEELADQVWEAWDKGEIDDQIAWLAWWLVALDDKQTGQSSTTLR
jgi:hypothetical protein